MKFSRSAFLLSAVACLAATEGTDVSEAARRVRLARDVLKEAVSPSDTGIPHDLLKKANCAAIVPGLKQGAFIVGAKYGKGV